MFSLLTKYSALENYEFSSLQKAPGKLIQNEFGFNAHVFINIRGIQL